MVVLFVALTIAQCLLEWWVNHNYPKIKELQVRKPWFNLIFSLGLSFVIGLAFPAAGLIVMMSALFSTVIMMPYYAVLRKTADMKESGRLSKEKVKQIFTRPTGKLAVTAKLLRGRR